MTARLYRTLRADVTVGDKVEGSALLWYKLLETGFYTITHDGVSVPITVGTDEVILHLSDAKGDTKYAMIAHLYGQVDAFERPGIRNITFEIDLTEAPLQIYVVGNSHSMLLEWHEQEPGVFSMPQAE